MFRKHIPDGVFSTTQYLPNKRNTDKGRTGAANTNISTENRKNNKINKHAQTNQTVVEKHYKCY